MGCPAQAIFNKTLTFTKQYTDSYGQACDATGVVSYSIYEDETATAIVTGTMTQVGSVTGFYSEQITISTANGFDSYKSYSIRLSATVDGTIIPTVFTFSVVGAGDAHTATTGALTSLANFQSYTGLTGNDALQTALIARATSAIENYCRRTLVSDTYREIYDGTGTGELILKQYPVTDITMVGVLNNSVATIRNTSSDAYHSYVTVSESDGLSETLTGVVQGGTNDGSNSETLTTRGTYTLTTLAAAVNAWGGGWDMSVTSVWGKWDAVEILPFHGRDCTERYVYIDVPDPLDDYEIRYDMGTIFTDKISTLGGFTSGRRNIVVRYTAGYVTTPADLEQICIDLTKVYWDRRSKDVSTKSEKLGDYAYTLAEGASAIPAEFQIRLAPYKKWSTSYVR